MARCGSRHFSFDRWNFPQRRPASADFPLNSSVATRCRAFALPDAAFGALAVFRILLEPVAQLAGVLLQALDAAGVLGGQVGFSRQGVVLPVAGEHDLGGGFEFAGLPLEVGASAAPGFAGIAGQLDAVDGEHFPADQSLPVAQVEDLGKEFGDVVAQAGDEACEGGVVRHAVAAEGDEGDVLAAGAPSFAFVAEPQTNGVAERFNRTLKEQVFHGRVFKNLEEVRVAVAEFKERYNCHWRLEEMGFMSPLEVRQAHAMRKAA